MPKLLGLDYGAKRCGLAETDELQMIAGALDTVPTSDLNKYLNEYLKKNKVEAIVIGLPERAGGELSDVESKIQTFIEKFKKSYSAIAVERIDESYTSQMAMQTMIASGAGRKKRSTKGNLDKISATLILQQFLENKRHDL
jgi:putative Holliday junction resolvase